MISTRVQNKQMIRLTTIPKIIIKKKKKTKLGKNDTSRSSEPHGGLVRRVCRSYSRKKSLIRSLIGYKDEHSRKRNLKTLFPSSK